MNGTTMTERLVAAMAHLIVLAALLPYFLGMHLIPIGPMWFGGLAVNAIIAMFAWKRSSFVARHSVLGAVWLMAAWLPEVLALVFFVIAMLAGIRINMGNGTLMDGVFAGQNPETLLRIVLAPVFLAVPCYYAFQAACGKECWGAR